MGYLKSIIVTTTFCHIAITTGRCPLRMWRYVMWQVKNNLCVVGSYLVGFRGLFSLFPLILIWFPLVDNLLQYCCGFLW